MKTLSGTDKARQHRIDIQAIEVNGMVYTSGVIPVVPETGRFLRAHRYRQQVFTNLSHLLEAAGTSMDNVVKTTVFIKEMTTAQ